MIEEKKNAFKDWASKSTIEKFFILIKQRLSLNADCRVIKNEGRLKMRPFKWVMPDEYSAWEDESRHFYGQGHERYPLHNYASACLISFLVAGWLITWPESFSEGVIRLLCFLFFLYTGWSSIIKIIREKNNEVIYVKKQFLKFVDSNKG